MQERETGESEEGEREGIGRVQWEGEWRKGGDREGEWWKGRGRGGEKGGGKVLGGWLPEIYSSSLLVSEEKS